MRHTTERIAKPTPGWSQLNSGDYLLTAFERRKTSLGIRRFLNRYIKDLIRERYKTGNNNDFLATQYCVENIEALLFYHPNPVWEAEKNNFIAREVDLWGMNRPSTTKALAS